MQISKCQKCQNLIGPELQCSQVSYFLQKASDTTNSGGPILHGLFRSLEHTRLTAIKSAFGLDIIQSTPLCQNKFGPRKSSLHPLLFETQILFSFKILLFLDSYLLDIYKIKNIKQQNDTYLSFKSQNNYGLRAADLQMTGQVTTRRYDNIHRCGADIGQMTIQVNLTEKINSGGNGNAFFGFIWFLNTS